MSWKWILVVLVLIVLIIFSAQNYEVVTIQFLLWSFKTSGTIVIFITLLIGMVMGGNVSLLMRGKGKKRAGG
jgi:uncharacterized integral membrane protein